MTGVRNSVTPEFTALDRIWLKFVQPGSVDVFEPGEKISVKIYSEQQVAVFDSEVIRVFGPAHEHLIVSKPVDGTLVKQEKPGG